MKSLNKIKILLISLFLFVAAISFIGCKEPDPIYFTPEVTLDDYTPYEEKPPVFGEITLDGVMDEAVWADQEVGEITLKVGGVDYYVSLTSYYTEHGIVIGANVEGSPVYYNPSRYTNHNSGLEFYVAPGGTEHINKKAWQISTDVGNNVDPYLFFNTAYITFGADVQLGTTVSGQLNTVNSDGYTMEMMVAWECVNSISRPIPYVNLDAAIIDVNSYVGDRNAWVSIGREVIPGWSFSSPKTWFTFTKDGFFDSSKTPDYTVNDGNALSNGQIEVVGSVKEGYFVKATPLEGYRMSALTINDVSYDVAKVNFDKNSLPVLDIHVEFLPIEGEKRNIIINKGFAYCEQVIQSGTAVTLKNADGDLYTGFVGDNGEWEVNVPNGDYTFIAQGFNPLSVTITDDTVYQVSFRSNTFVSYNNVTVDETLDTGATLIFNQVGVPQDNIYFAKYNVDFSNKVVIDQKIKVQLGNPIFFSVRFKDSWSWNFGNYINIGSWTGAQALYIKHADGTTLETLNSSNTTIISENGKNYIEVRLVQVINGNTLEVYRATDDGYVLYGKFVSDRPIVEGYATITDYQGEVILSDVQIYDGNTASLYKTATVSVGDTGESDVTLSASEFGFGDTVTITVVPKIAEIGTNVIKNVLVNGKPVEYEIVDDVYRVLFTHASDSTSYQVTVITENLLLRNVTINLTAKLYSGQTANVLGKTVYLTGEYANSFIVEDSNTINLPDGDYQLLLEGYLPVSIKVSGDTNLNVVLAQNIFTPNQKFTYGYSETDGYYYTSSTKNSWMDLENVPETGNVKVSLTYSGRVASNVQQWTSICFYNDTDNVIEVQLLTWGATFRLKNVHANTWQIICSETCDYSNDFVITLIDGVLSVYYANDLVNPIFTTNESKNGGALQNFSKISIFYGYDNASDWKITNLKIESI